MRIKSRYGKKLFMLLSAFLVCHLFLYSEELFTISESQLQELESLRIEQELQIEKLETQFNDLNLIIEEQQNLLKKSEDIQLLKKIKIGGIWFGIGVGAGALTTILICLSAN